MPRSIFVSALSSRTSAWLSQAEAAEYLGITQRTIRAYIARGTLPASRVRGSRLVRIKQSDLEALLRPIPTTESVGV